MSTALLSPHNLQATLGGLSVPLSRLPEGLAEASARRFRALRARAPLADREVSGRDIVLVSTLVVLLHLGLALLYAHRDRSVSLVHTPEVEIELIRPQAEPPKEIEPPRPLPPPPRPVRQQLPPPLPSQPAPLRTAPAEAAPAADVMTVQENTSAPRSSGPVVAVTDPSPAPPPPKVEEPVTEASANAAYLKNPPPEYPMFAQRQGWEGTVLLRVHVLSSGKPEHVEIKQSSGRKTLDEAALTAVRNWTFVPSRRGSTPVDGWATVPIEFKLAK